MNWAMLGEFVLAVLITQMDLFDRLLDTTQLNLRQFGWALIPSLALLLLWALGKYVARRQISDRSGGTPPVSASPGR
jgi:P-type Ca2+ transporter type 2C